MLSPLRNRFGIPGAISVIALVFAMIGGAYAASNDSGGGKATASAKAKKGPRGPRGPRGPAGPVGPAGPQGPAGAAGKDGANGLNGEDGEDGKTGATGAQGKVGPTGATGATGDSGAPGASGATGATGATGSPWVPDNKLPSGATLTGTWGFGPVAAVFSEAETPSSKPLGIPISFPIPMPVELASSAIARLKKEEAPTTNCPGTPSEPKALPGKLCLYTADASKEFDGVEGTWFQSGFRKAGSTASGASTAGTVFRVIPLEKGAFAYGTWAVTAPTAP